jgi:hypothetical protein
VVGTRTGSVFAVVIRGERQDFVVRVLRLPVVPLDVFEIQKSALGLIDPLGRASVIELVADVALDETPRVGA